MDQFTQRQIVEKLDQYIIGQNDAKRAVAVALRNRYRRNQLDEKIRDEIIPKNILMIGPTGVGKTEIARRIAKIVKAPFVKVEATKFTEVGYVGRDVESMVRDLVENAIRIVKEEKMNTVLDKAEEAANERLVKLLVPSIIKQGSFKNPLEMLFGGGGQPQETKPGPEQLQEEEVIKGKRDLIRHRLAKGDLENEIVTIEIEESPQLMLDLPGSGMDQLGGMQDAISNLMPKKKKKRKLSVTKAREFLIREEAHKLIDMDDVTQTAVHLTEQNGIIFIDEIDKIASKSGSGASSVDVSREGVQRDILPIVEGSTVNTKYGPVKTDYILFIAAGAFHISKPSDLIPELQGRFPIRVELQKLSIEDFYRILVEPDNALLKQYAALLGTENIDLKFSDEAIRQIAQVAFDVNQDTDNIGARRLHTILEKLLEDLSFEAPDINMASITITPQYVDEKLGKISKNKDLSQFIL